MDSRQVIFVLASASQALKGEAALRAAGVQCALIPVPRTLSAQCGVCLRVAFADRHRAEELLAGSGIRVSAVHEIDDRPGKTAQSGKETA